MELATKLDLVKKSGAWYAYEGDKIGQGRENAKTYLSAHPEIMEELEKKVREHYQLGTDSSEKDEKEVNNKKALENDMRKVLQGFSLSCLLIS